MTSVPEQRAAIARAQRARAAAIEIEGLLASGTDDEEEFKVVLAGRSGERAVLVSRAVVEGLAEILEAMGNGREPSVVPMAKELSTGEVAGLLGVSRQYAVRLLDDGKLPFRRVGNRRRVRLSDAVRYLRDDDRRRVERLAEAAAALS